MSPVLVTGGSGYLGTQLIVALLREGRRVRATVRSLDGEGDVRVAVRRGAADDSLLEIVAAWLTADEGWAAAAAGCAEVHHVASPMIQSDDPGEVIVPARDGTLRVLRAARDAGARRVVLTSSLAAVGYSPKPGAEYTEADWTDSDTPGLPAYPRSKAIAEPAAWDFIEHEGGATELTVVNPTFILGPTLTTRAHSSLQLTKAMLDGTMPVLRRQRFGVAGVVVAVVLATGGGSGGTSAGAFDGFVASDMAIAPDGARAYVLGVSTSGGSTAVQVVPVDPRTGKPGTPIALPAPARDHGSNGTITLAPGGRTGYVSYPGDSTITPVDLAAGKAGHPITLRAALLGGSGSGVCGLAVTPGGTAGYVTGCGAVDAGTVLPVSLPSGTPGRPIRINVGTTGGSLRGITGYSLALTPGGTTGYVIFVQGSHKTGAIVPLVLPGGPPGPPVRLGTGVQGAAIAVAPNGTAAYVASTAGQGGLHTRVGVLPPASG